MTVDPEKWTWYVARSGGIVAWVLLAAGLAVGLLLSSKVLGRRVSPAWQLSIHRYLGGLSVVFTAVHVAAVMLDDFVDFGWADVLVPYASEWRPEAVAWGIVAMYLLVAIEVTSLAMRRLPKRLWRAVHWSSAALFVTATVHGWQAGTDTGRAFMAATVLSIVVLAVLTFVRIARAARRSPRRSGARGPDRSISPNGPKSGTRAGDREGEVPDFDEDALVEEHAAVDGATAVPVQVADAVSAKTSP